MDENPLDGHTPERIAEWTGASIRTAQDWKAGRRHPGPQSLALIQLHAQGRVRPTGRRWEGIRFHRGQLINSTGEAMHPGEIDQVGLYRNLLHLAQTDRDRLTKKLAQAEEYIQYLEAHTPRAPITPLPTERMRPSLTEGMDDNPYFQKARTA